MNKDIKVLITETSKTDIYQIIGFVAKDNKKAALNIIDTFDKTIKMLSKYPYAGTKKAGIKNKSVLIYTVKKRYSLIYRVKDNQLEILRILTRYQDIFAIL